MGQYQKGKTNLDFTEARDSEWQWHQLGHMQVGTSLQTDNHTTTPPLSFFTGRMPFLPPNQQRQSTEGISGTQSCYFYYRDEYISMSICGSIRERISRILIVQMSPSCLRMFSMPVARRRCDMLLTSGFVDDVIIFQENFLTMMGSGDIHVHPLSLSRSGYINQSINHYIWS